MTIGYTGIPGQWYPQNIRRRRDPSTRNCDQELQDQILGRKQCFGRASAEIPTIIREK